MGQEAMTRLTLAELHEELSREPDLLLVQDVDGVCMPLVRDPLDRRLEVGYIEAAASLDQAFRVLTNGEHTGPRGLNRLVDQALAAERDPAAEALYLPGLAAGGVQLQDRRGNLSHPGVSGAELAFLAAVPQRLQERLEGSLNQVLPEVDGPERQRLSQQAVLANPVSPTLNLNGLFARVGPHPGRRQGLQRLALQLMEELLAEARQAGLEDSFFVHLAPNLGIERGRERLKPAAGAHGGTTDVQFMLRGARKEAGLLVLLNRHIAAQTGDAPLGHDFNARNAPEAEADLLRLCRERIAAERMPTLVGVADTITSEPSAEGKGWRRGGSDRGFLQLVQRLGEISGRPNRVVLVDSSGGELDRPGLADPRLPGLSDPADPLHIDVLVPGGPAAYVSWFEQLAERRRVGSFC
jgi:glucosylglycerol 3-phosphatase